jgi:general secretion pathway protein C
VDSILRKYLWIVDLVVVGLCAVFLGLAASSAFESKFLGSVTLPRPAPHFYRGEPEAVRAKETEEILKRNIFCSTCPPIIQPALAPVDAGPAPPPPPQKTSLPLQLLVVNFAPPPWGFQYSTAVLRDTDDKMVGAFRVGNKVKGATVTGIDETRVHLDNEGKPEFIDLLDESPANPSRPVAVEAPVAPAAPRDDVTDALKNGIKKTGENTYEIGRSTLETVLGNMSLLSRSARIVPEIRDGKAAGFRLYSVRPEGPFALIGMQNGDVISVINGLEITSPEKALEVYAKLKSASHLSVGIERNGQRVTKEYSIR